MDFFLIIFFILSLIFPSSNGPSFGAGDSGLVAAPHLIPSAYTAFPSRRKGAPMLNQNNLTAGSALVIDKETGRILFEKNSSQVKSIASLTKLMTALLWLKLDNHPDKIIEIQSKDYREGGIPYFIAGEQVRARDLFSVALVASSNSAIATLVRSTGKTEEEFVNLMNDEANKLGMKNTKFQEPIGLDYRNVSTASDLFILTREALSQPEIRKATQYQSYAFSLLNKNTRRSVKNTNWLIYADNKDYKIIGGKTGYIEESNYNLIIEVKSARKNKNVIIILLGSTDSPARFREAEELIIWTYDNYLWKI